MKTTTDAILALARMGIGPRRLVEAVRNRGTKPDPYAGGRVEIVKPTFNREDIRQLQKAVDGAYAFFTTPSITAAAWTKLQEQLRVAREILAR